MTFAAAILVAAFTTGCTTGIVDPGNLDGSSVQGQEQTGEEERLTLSEDSSSPGNTSVDGGTFADGGTSTVDLTANPGDPCTYGQCAEGLICMANVCHTICSTGCGDTAPECAPTDGCHWVTSFAAACLPGTAKHRQNCGGGIFCEAGHLCAMVGNNPARCLKLCKYGCPFWVQCGETDNGCSVCIE